MLRLFQRRRPGGEAQHHVPAAAAAGFGDDLDFPPAMRIFPGDVVHLHVIHAPGGVQRKNAVIIRPDLRQLAAQAVHIRVPGAHRIGIRRLGAGSPAAVNGQAPVSRHPRQAPHDMNAKLQPKAVHILRQGPEARAVRRAGEAVYRRQQPAIIVHGQFREGLIFVGIRRGLIPLNVHHNIFPAEFFQMFRHVIRVLANGFLVHRRAVAIPAVPPHGRRFRDHFFAS